MEEMAVSINVSHKMIDVPTLLRVLKASAEMMAPALPAAVEIPWAVAWKRVGNT